MGARLLLVPSPLVGSATWEPVATDLAAAGYTVTVPDLAGTLAAGPTYHLRQAQVVAGRAAGREVILVGYSRAGSLLATIGTMLRQRVRDYIFVDARMPTPGQAYDDEAARARDLGWPVRELPSHHLALLTQPGQVAREIRELIGQL